MSGPKQLLQRLQVPLLTACDPLYAAGRRWFRLGTSLHQEQHEQLLMSRLSGLTRSFESRGLLREPVWRQLGGADRFSALAEMPVLTREGLRELYPALARLYGTDPAADHHVSGGATGEPVQFYYSRRQRRLAGGCALGMYSILGWRPGMPRFSLWGREPGRSTIRPPRGVRGRMGSWLKHTQVFGGYAPLEDEYWRFLDAVRAQPGCAVLGFTSLLERCALLMLERDRTLPPGFLSTAWACSEMLHRHQKERIEEAFGVQLRRHYGSRECTTLAVDCAAGSLHISPRYIVQAIDLETRAPLPAGQTCSLLVTDLFNDATPFIRYELGDFGAVEWRDCACGLRGFCLAELTGRTAGLFTLESGTQVTALFVVGVLDYFPQIHQCQAVRTGATRFEMRYTGGPLAPETARELETMTSRLLEGAQVRAVPVEELGLSPTGKLIPYREEMPGSPLRPPDNHR